MAAYLLDRREVLMTVAAGAAAGLLPIGARDAAAQAVKWSEGTDPPKLKAPANACDCHHHIYDAKYPVDPNSTLRPGDAFVEDYRAFQKRIGTSRNVVEREKKPDDAILFDLLLACAPDESLRHRILVENPAALYDFPKSA